jgi:flagellar motor switch protein FliG
MAQIKEGDHSLTGPQKAITIMLSLGKAAQNTAVVLAKELSNSGQITISEDKEDDELVY